MTFLLSLLSVCYFVALMIFARDALKMRHQDALRAFDAQQSDPFHESLRYLARGEAQARHGGDVPQSELARRRAVEIESGRKQALEVRKLCV